MYNAISNHIHTVQIKIKHVKTNNIIQIIIICSAAASKMEKLEIVYSELQNVNDLLSGQEISIFIVLILKLEDDRKC